MGLTEKPPMRGTLLPKICFLWLIVTVLQVAGQTKPAAEADIVKCWGYPLSDTPAQTLATDGARLFLGFEGAKIEALSLDGKRLWSTDLGGASRSNILSFDGGMAVVTATASIASEGAPDNTLRFLSKETGITNRTVKLPAADHYFLGLANGLVIVVSKSGVIQSLDEKGGAIKWKREIATSFVGTPVFNGERVVVASGSNQLFSVGLASGEIESMRKMPFPITALAQMGDGKMVTGDDRGNVTLLNGIDKPAWRFRSGGEIRLLSNAERNILAVSHDNFVYLISGRNGDVIWKKRMLGRAAEAVPYAGRYVLISGIEEHVAVLVDMTNGKVAGQIAFADNETVIKAAAGVDQIFVLTNEAAYAFSVTGCPKHEPK